MPDRRPLVLTRGTPIVVLTGAGISKESGLHTFRDPDGIWAQYRIEEVATPEAFRRHPERVQGFYNARRRSLVDPAIQPNAAHLALARLEAEWSGDVLLVTQNVDDLHDRAGSRRMIHMHGEMLKARCLACAATVPWRADIEPTSACPACNAVGHLRPHVVWFGEMPLEMERIYAALGHCGLFVSIGTSGAVYPAASFVAEAKQAANARTVELNLEPSLGALLFDDGHYGLASEVVPEFVDRLLRAA